MVGCAIGILFLAREEQGMGGANVVLMTMLAFSLWQVPLLFAHEAGHAIAARLVGAPPYAVIVGHEPWRIDREAFGLRWRIGSLLDGGVTYHEACEGRGARWRSILITAAGPATNLLIASVAFLVSNAVANGIAVFALGTLGFASAVQCVANLWPRSIMTPVGVQGSDGARIISLLRGHADDVRRSRGARNYLEAYFAFTDEDSVRAMSRIDEAAAYWTEPPLSHHVAVLRSAVLIGSDEPRAAVDLLRPLVESPAEDWGARAFVANNFACACALLDDVTLHDEALAQSAHACEIAFWEYSMIATRACLLAVSATVDNGRVAKARALVAAQGRVSLTRRQRAWTAAVEGICAAVDGDFPTARRSRDRARAQGASPALLRMLERRIPSH